MITRQAALAGAAALAALLIATSATMAHGHGGHAHYHGHRRGVFGAWPYYGGYVAAPAYAPAYTYAQRPEVIYVAEPPRALSCHHSEQTVTVPAEAGGTRTITVDRC
jgi:hypothetical protein